VIRSVLVGTAASLLVLLFLNMISSNPVDLIKCGDDSKLLILLGVCLVAAISSTAR
jgi:YLATT-like protein